MAVADPSGPIHLLFCLHYMRCIYCRSDDDGATFSPPTDITAAFDTFAPEYPWKVQATGHRPPATGPGHVIRLRTGRLVVPVWLSRGTGRGGHHPSTVATVVSDDHGKTWRRGAIVADETNPLTDPNETAAVELSDGRVLLSIRHESARRRRATAVGPDGAGGWSKPKFNAAPVGAGVHGRTGAVAGGGQPHRVRQPSRHRPAEPGGQAPHRQRGEVGGRAGHRDPGPAGYPDLAATADSTVRRLYERGEPGAKWRPPSGR